MTPRLSALAITALTAPLAAQAIPVPLANNFNGIVHAGESGIPDDPNGFRSISDRALDFTAGVPNDPLLAGYQVVTTAGTLDIVHLGNRNTVDNSSKPFDPVPNTNNLGIQPNWLPNPDQSGPQISVLQSPMPVGATTIATFLYQVSNGGGAFDVTFTFQNSPSFTATLTAGDWFGGTLPGTGQVDVGSPDNNLSLTEGRVDLSAFAGDNVTEITFSNASNVNAGYAIVACNFEYPPVPSGVIQIPLNYNFNGIVHAGESGQPDALTGYRSISDRGLDFTAGVPADPLLAPYSIVDAPGVLDIVHVGNRDTVNNSGQPFDLAPDNDDIGVTPSWLPNPDQTGPQVTVLSSPILLDGSSRASVLFQISNGGGSFDIELGFLAGPPVIATVTGSDWFGGTLPGTANVDSGLPGANLSLTERTINLFNEAGRTLTSISFQNRTNTNAGYAVVAMNVIGCGVCNNAATGAQTDLGGGTGPTLSSLSTTRLGCDLDWSVAGATPNGVGFFLLGLGSAPTPLSSFLPACTSGTVHIVNPSNLFAPLSPTGSATVNFNLPLAQFVCGVTFTAQFAELVPGNCFVSISNGLSLTIGN
ncbi:MAG: hypothetical protein NXI31_13185 [bacterium]|nr:hypothetical protein [bacterium]